MHAAGRHYSGVDVHSVCGCDRAAHHTCVNLTYMCESQASPHSKASYITHTCTHRLHGITGAYKRILIGHHTCTLLFMTSSIDLLQIFHKPLSGLEHRSHCTLMGRPDLSHASCMQGWLIATGCDMGMHACMQQSYASAWLLVRLIVTYFAQHECCIYDATLEFFHLRGRAFCLMRECAA